jgi:hypothetical protein
MKRECWPFRNRHALSVRSFDQRANNIYGACPSSAVARFEALESRLLLAVTITLSETNASAEVDTSLGGISRQDSSSSPSDVTASADGISSEVTAEANTSVTSIKIDMSATASGLNDSAIAEGTAFEAVMFTLDEPTQVAVSMATTYTGNINYSTAKSTFGGGNIELTGVGNSDQDIPITLPAGTYTTSDSVWVTGALAGITQTATVTFSLTFSQSTAAIQADSLGWSVPSGGLTGEYSITNAPLPEGVPINVYWATGPDLSDTIGDPVSSTNSNTAIGTYSITVSPDALLTKPAGAITLLLVVDPNNSLGNGPSVQWVDLQTPALAMATVNSPQSNSLSFSYNILNSSITQSFHVGFYESATPTYDPTAANVTLGPGVDIVPGDDTTVGQHEHTIPFAQALPVDFSLPYILAVADPSQALIGVTETNNVAYFENAIDLSPLGLEPLGGAFIFDPQSNRHTFTGIVLMGLASTAAQPFQPLMQLNGTASYDTNMIQLSGNVLLDAASSQTELFNGTWTIPVGQGGSNNITIQTATSADFAIAGLTLNVTSILMESQGVALQGTISLPVNENASSSSMTFSATGAAAISVEGNNSILVTPTGIALSGGLLQLPKVAITYAGASFQATDMVVEYTSASDTLTIQGNATLTGSGGVTLDANFAAPNMITIQNGTLNCIGTVSLSDLSIGAWTLTNGSIAMDTITNTLSATALIRTPLGVEPTGQLAFRLGYLDTVSVGVDFSDQGGTRIGSTLLYLQSISGEIDNLFDETPDSIIFKGNLVLTEGPVLALPLPSWLGGPVSGSAVSLAIAGWFNSTQIGGTATLTIAGGAMKGEGTLSLDEATGAFSESCTFSVLGGLGMFNGQLTGDAEGNIYFGAQGSATFPAFTVVGGYVVQPTPLASASIVVQDGPAQPETDDFIMVSGTLFGSDPASVTVYFNGNYSMSAPSLSTSSLQSIVDTNPAPTFQISADDDLETLLSDIAALSQPPTLSTISIQLGSGAFSGFQLSLPSQIALNVTGESGTMISGVASALVVNSGMVAVSGLTLTLLNDVQLDDSELTGSVISINGGGVTLRDDQIIAPAGSTAAAVSVSGGSLDLGTLPNPGDNSLHVNGVAAYVVITTSNIVSTFGNTFYRDSVAVSVPPPSSSLAQLPARIGTASITVNWSGKPATEGLPIASYSVFVSTDGDPYFQWITDTTLTSAVFSGQVGHAYRFYSMARDTADNTQLQSLSSSMAVVITSTPWQNPVQEADVNDDGIVTPLDALTVINFLNSKGVGQLPSAFPAGGMNLDVNGDDSVTSTDASLVLDYLNSELGNFVRTRPGVAMAAVDKSNVEGATVGPNIRGISMSVTISPAAVSQSVSSVGMESRITTSKGPIFQMVTSAIGRRPIGIMDEGRTQHVASLQRNAPVKADSEFESLIGILAEVQVRASRR